MKIMISVLGVLIILAGVVPFLNEVGLVPSFIPTTQPGYQLLIIGIGTAGLLYGVMNSLLFGFEKFVTIAIGLLTILGGIVPFLQNFIELTLPISGPIYSIGIVVIGVVGLIYGFVALG